MLITWLRSSAQEWYAYLITGMARSAENNPDEGIQFNSSVGGVFVVAQINPERGRQFNRAVSLFTFETDLKTLTPK